MFGIVAVDKEIYSIKPPQISVCLWKRQTESIGKCPDTAVYIFNDMMGKIHILYHSLSISP